jgi:MinD-like ATPase involved in chromosome partitioning or flagellar assembly
MSRPLKALMYSFKGGAGRTVTTANVAHQLSRKHDVLVVDLDVESAGTSVLFGVDGAVENGTCFSVQDVLCGVHRIDRMNEEFLRRYYAASDRPFDPEILRRDGDDGTDNLSGASIDMDRDEFEECIWPFLHAVPKDFRVNVIPARRMVTNADFVRRSNDSTKRFQTMLLQIEALTEVPAFILFDSAAGIQDTALLGLQSADVLVIFARWSRQFMSGTIQLLKNWVTHPELDRLQRVLIVPTAVPGFLDEGRAPKVLEDRRTDFKKAIAEINKSAKKRWGRPEDWVDIDCEIPESDELKWDDRIIAEEPLPNEQMRSLVAAYGRLASRLEQEREALT